MSSSNSTQPDDTVVQTKRSRLGSLLGVQVVGVGSSVPDNLVRNEDLASLGYDADWILQRTGILERRHALEDMATSDLAVEAAQRCIEHAQVDPQDIDLLLLGTFTPDMLLPSTACVVQDRLGLCAPAMDIQAACASFVYAMITGTQFIACGSSRLVLVIGADCNSRMIDPADKHTFPLFGDAAGAVLLAPGSKQQGLVSYAVGSDGSGAELLCRRMGGSRLPFSYDPESNGQHFLRMEGKPIFKWAIRVLGETISDVLEASNAKLGVAINNSSRNRGRNASSALASSESASRTGSNFSQTAAN